MRPRLAVQAITIAGGVLVVFAIGGTKFLQLLQVSMPAFEVAPGILLLLQSIELIFAHPGGLSALTATEEMEAKRSSEIAVFPLAIPLIAGPASITAAMLLMGQASADPLRVAVFFVALFIALALTYLMLMLVEPLGRVLGVTGTNVIARISGILLAALAVQFILDGIRESHLVRMNRHPLNPGTAMSARLVS
jgi:MarC family membrane protein